MNPGTQATKRGELNHIKTLSQLVDDYLTRFHHYTKNNGHSDPLVDFCINAPSLGVAITRACRGRREDGRMFSEDSCVRTSSKEKLRTLLMARVQSIKRCKDFEDLYDLVREVLPWGCGVLCAYNVTHRIGAHMGLEPRDYLYIHAGPLQGWKRLTGIKGNLYRVPLAEVPAEMKRLPIHQMEDFLCEYRDFVHPGLLEREAA